MSFEAHTSPELGQKPELLPTTFRVSAYRAQSTPWGRPLMCSEQAPIVKLEVALVALALATEEALGDMARPTLLLHGERCGICGGCDWT